jgi:hypothetical protein
MDLLEFVTTWYYIISRVEGLGNAGLFHVISSTFVYIQVIVLTGPPMATMVDIAEDGSGPPRKDEGGVESQSQRNRKWERTTQDDFLEINEEFIPSFPQDEEVVGIITMEDVIEELLQVLFLELGLSATPVIN